jgi:sugar phosphate isomerase/epimerase
MDKIALSAISFHQALFSGRMSQTDIPARAAAMGFTAVELLDLLAVPLPFGHATGMVRRAWHTVKSLIPFAPHNPRPIRPKGYLPTVGSELRQVADQAGVRVISWTLDTDLAVTGDALKEAEAYWERGIATAHALGAKVLRITSGGAPNSALLPLMRNNLERLVTQSNGLKVGVENHGGLSSDPALLAALVEGIAGCCLDLGNYPAPIRYEAVKRLAPHAVHVHAKSYAFDDAGNETSVDYPAFIGLFQAEGYQGYYSIEYEGYGDAEQGIQQTKALLARLL